MNRIKRGTIITINHIGDNKFIVSDVKGNIFYQADEDFHIYFKTAYFHGDGTIMGRYLGDTDGRMQDDFAYPLSHDRGAGIWLSEGGREFDTARLASIENGKGLWVIVEEKQR